MATAREFGWLGYNVRHTPTPSAHTVDQMLALVEAEGIEVVPDMRLYVPEPAVAWWCRRARELGLDGRPYPVLAPTSRWPSKRWPAERWAQLLPPLSDRGMGRPVLVGAPGEADQVRAIVEAAGGPDLPVNLVGALTVGQAMAVIAGAELVVANDSAPLHIALGFDRPCVAIFGPTDPARVGPYGRPGSVLRCSERIDDVRAYKDRRLGDALMRRISTGQVIERIDELLGERDPGSPARRDAAVPGNRPE
jgi:ADP-heptose:LPS heptosyltransferase